MDWIYSALVSIKNPGLTSNLSFVATTDKNGTQVRCNDVIDTNSMICTIMTSHYCCDLEDICYCLQ